jgi:hypothetical protein
MKQTTIRLAEDHGIEAGTRPPRAQFSAPSPKTRAHEKYPSVWAAFARQMLGGKARPATTGRPQFGVHKNQT